MGVFTHVVCGANVVAVRGIVEVSDCETTRMNLNHRWVNEEWL
jgi:hypothetical protein